MAQHADTEHDRPEDTTAGEDKPGRRAERARRLARARQRDADQLVDERERQRQVAQAVEAYVSAAVVIADAETACEEKIRRLAAEHERRVARLREQCEDKIGERRGAQAVAAFRMHQYGGRTVEQVGELCEVSEKEARRLIAAGRHADDGEAAPGDGARQRHQRDGKSGTGRSRDSGTTRDTRTAQRSWPDAEPTAAEQPSGEAPSSGAAGSGGRRRSGPQRDLSGVDAQQHPQDGGRVPPVPDGAAQGA